jgi:hypothetical protein
MQKEPRSPRGLLFFWLFLLAIAVAIGTTVLLAHNHRNLNRLLIAAGLRQPEQMIIPKPGKMESFRGKRLKGVEVMIPGHVFYPGEPDIDSTFLRTMPVEGKAICVALEKAGFKMTAWQPGTFATDTRECWVEEKLDPAEAQSNDPSTFFMIIRGLPDGTVSSARAKIVFHTDVARKRAIERAILFVQTLAQGANWGELRASVADIAALKPFSLNLSGVAFRFFKEFSGDGNFNLLLFQSVGTSAEKRSKDYFDPANYFPLLPEYGGPPLIAGSESH